MKNHFQLSNQVNRNCICLKKKKKLAASFQPIRRTDKNRLEVITLSPDRGRLHDYAQILIGSL